MTNSTCLFDKSVHVDLPWTSLGTIDLMMTNYMNTIERDLRASVDVPKESDRGLPLLRSEVSRPISLMLNPDTVVVWIDAWTLNHEGRSGMIHSPCMKCFILLIHELSDAPIFVTVSY